MSLCQDCHKVFLQWGQGKKALIQLKNEKKKKEKKPAREK